MARFEVPDGWVAQAYRFALDPTPAQVSMLESHCGAARFAFNDMLGVVKANLDQRGAERSERRGAGHAEDDVEHFHLRARCELLDRRLLGERRERIARRSG